MIHLKYIKNYWEPIMIIIAVITSLISIGLGILTNTNNSDKEKITSQIITLNIMSDNLKEMIKFIEVQKTKMIEEQKTLDDIKQEREKIEPLLSADKKVVEAVFKMQEERQIKSIWIDRAFGFFLGISSSIIATLIINYFRKRRATT